MIKFSTLRFLKISTNCNEIKSHLPLEVFSRRYLYIEIHYSMFSFSMIILEKPLNDEIVWACQGYHDVGQGRLLQFR